jgi:DNA-binding GntR family transcriptional regulator
MPDFDPVVTREALPDRIYAALKHRILTCRLLPGQRLIEKELCAEMNISRTPLREALNRLGLEGLITLEPYKGYEVTSLTLDDIRDLSEVRTIVESETTALAAQRATQEEIENLAEMASLQYTPGNRATYENYLRENSAFHLALARCSHNRRLELIVASVIDQIQRPLYMGLDVGLDAEEATAEHMVIVDAIRNRDSRLARRLMRDQIAEAEKRMIAALTPLGSDVGSALIHAK